MRRLLAGAVALAAAATAPVPAVASAEARTARLGDRPLERGARGADVRELQRTLRRLRLRTAVDGVFGRETAGHVRRYERRVRIPRDGAVSIGQARGMRRRARLPFAGDPAAYRERSAATRKRTNGATPGAGLFPVRGEVRWGDGFGERGGRHQGVDLLASCGTPLVSPVAGEVVNVKTHEAAGHYVVVRADGTGEEHVLMHLTERSLVARGTRVAAGQQLGAVGRSGNASTCHLHFEIWTAPGWYRGGEPRDPRPDLRAWAGDAA